MKRQTDTDKWKKGWFQKLSAKHKCLWEYLRDNCDNAGVIESSPAMASFFIGEVITEEDYKVFGNRLVKLPNGKLFIRKFIQFQWGKLSENSPPHKTVIRLIEKHGIAELVNEVYDEEQEEKKEIAVVEKKIKKNWRELITYPYTEQDFLDAWTRWLDYRKKIRKSYKTIESEQAQLDWFKERGYTYKEAVEIINNSIRANWQGLFDLKNKSNEVGKRIDGSNKGGDGTSGNRIKAAKDW